MLTDNGWKACSNCGFSLEVKCPHCGQITFLDYHCEHCSGKLAIVRQQLFLTSGLISRPVSNSSLIENFKIYGNIHSAHKIAF